MEIFRKKANRLIFGFENFLFLSKFKNFIPNRPYFMLSGDIDSTILLDEQISTLKESLLVSKKFEIPYNIFIVPDNSHKLLELIKILKKHTFKTELGSHSLKHINHSKLDLKTQIEFFKKSKEKFEEIGTPVRGIRTPYLSRNMNTYFAASKIYDYDSSILSTGYSKILLKCIYPKIINKCVFFPIFASSDIYFKKRNLSAKEMFLYYSKMAKIFETKNTVFTILIHPQTYTETPEFLEKFLGFINNTKFKSDTFSGVLSDTAKENELEG